MTDGKPLTKWVLTGGSWVSVMQAFCIGSIASVLVITLGSVMAFSQSSPANVEETVCGWFKERAAFLSWSMAARRPNPDAWKAVSGAEPVSHKTRDGRMLRGFKISTPPASTTSTETRGFLLFAQGNPLLPDHCVYLLMKFATNG